MNYPVQRDYQERFEHDLIESELVWRDHYYLLLRRGYQLRPRYRPGWQGSWLTNGNHVFECEDHLLAPAVCVLDAIQTSKNVKVALKLVPTDTEEIPIGLYFSSDHLRTSPRNHCVPILDVIPLPHNDGFAFIVMPVLTSFDYPVPFQQKIECIEAFYQMIEGIEFMHEHNVAHRDACFFNFLMDATKLLPGGFHLSAENTHDGVRHISNLHHKSRRAVGPIRYYWIDFGLSNRFPSFEERQLVFGTAGQDKAPELSDSVPYDPFKVDIFQVGMTINHLCDGYEGLETFRPFARFLTQTRPQLRPTASEALVIFKQFTQRLSGGKVDGWVIPHWSLDNGRRKNRLRRKKISAWKKRKFIQIFKIFRIHCAEKKGKLSV